MTLKHSFTDLIADDPQSASDGKVLPSHWNADHAISGTDTAVLFNDGGVLGTDAGFLFDKTVNHASLGTGTIDQNINTASDLPASEILNVRDTITLATSGGIARRDAGAYFELISNFSIPRVGSHTITGSTSLAKITGVNGPAHAAGGEFYVQMVDAATVNTMHGVTGIAARTAGTIGTFMAGGSLQVEDELKGTTTVGYGGYVLNDGTCYAFQSYLENYDVNTIPAMTGVHVDTALNSGGGTITTVYGVKIENQTAGATNYNCWFGSGLYHYDGLTASRWVYSDASKNLVSKTDAEVAAAVGTAGFVLSENTSIGLDPAGSADGKYTGITVTAVAGYAQSFGHLVYLDPTDSRWEKTDANSAAGADGDARGTLGMVVVAGGSDGAACTILLRGIIRADAAFPAMTINNQMWVSETAGEIATTFPTTTDAVMRVVGRALTADELEFDPSGDYATHI